MPYHLIGQAGSGKNTDFHIGFSFDESPFQKKNLF